MIQRSSWYSELSSTKLRNFPLQAQFDTKLNFTRHWIEFPKKKHSLKKTNRNLRSLNQGLGNLVGAFFFPPKFPSLHLANTHACRWVLQAGPHINNIQSTPKLKVTFGLRSSFPWFTLRRFCHHLNHKWVRTLDPSWFAF